MNASARSVKAEGVNREPNASVAEATIKSTKTQGVRTPCVLVDLIEVSDAVRPRPGSRDKATPKLDPRKSGRKSNPSRKNRPDRDLSPDISDPRSDSDEGESDSTSSSDSSGEKAGSSTKTSSKPKVGSTLLTVRP
ncbi:unnamed protein product [Phytophthora fragariaefolia]|uniref:Unnamed protein product n=1 Tax=Phytophthora fragariaefolia TaxID=1490495 RepID=A0A9W6XP68_9STRA|nr:unnamed protein product [Phytophthora fragariaefolia]